MSAQTVNQKECFGVFLPMKQKIVNLWPAQNIKLSLVFHSNLIPLVSPHWLPLTEESHVMKREENITVA